MKNYNALLKEIIEDGVSMPDRTGTGRRSLFGRQLRFNMKDGFPLVTTRKINLKSVVTELLWFIQGEVNVNILNDAGVHIWDAWTLRKDDVVSILKTRFNIDDPELHERILDETKNVIDSIGPLYGFAWRSPSAQGSFSAFFPDIGRHPDPSVDKMIKEAVLEKWREFKPENANDTFTEASENQDFQDQLNLTLNQYFYERNDQLASLIHGLKTNPYSRRHVISAWIPSVLPIEGISPKENVMVGRGALPPCHVLQQYHVIPAAEEGGKQRLSLKMTMRSQDLPVGGPFNIAQYALMLHLVANEVGMEPYEYIHDMGDVHIYDDQIELVKHQLTLEPKPLPTLKIESPDISLFERFDINDFVFENYLHHDPIKYPVAV